MGVKKSHGDHGDKEPGCEQQRNGDLCTQVFLLCYSRNNYKWRGQGVTGKEHDAKTEKLEQGVVGEWDTTKYVLSQSRKEKAVRKNESEVKTGANCCQFLLQAVFLVCALSALCSAINQSMTAISNPAAWLLATAEFHESARPKIRCFGWVSPSEMRPPPGVQ